MTVTSHPQAALPLNDGRVPSFENFIAGENQLVLELVQASLQASTEQLFLVGAVDSGKTHLLQSAHRGAMVSGERSFYTSLREPGLNPQLFESLEGYSLVAIDDVDSISGLSHWEQALFNLINDCREAGTALIFSARSAPKTQNIQMPDLVTRFGWGPVVQLKRLSEQNCIALLTASAAEYGMELEAASANYLLSRFSRDLKSLLATLPLLEKESLAVGRQRITIPFLKSCLQIN